MIPWHSDTAPFLEMGPLNLASLLSKQVYELKTFSLYKFFLLLQQFLAKLCARGFLK